MSIKNIWFGKPKLMMIFIITWVVLISSLIILKNLSSSVYNQSKITELKDHLKCVTTNSEEISDYIFNYEVNRVELLESLRRVYSSKPKNINLIRDSIIAMYDKIYEKLEKLGIREFQIHLRDGEQFIYFNKINQFGSNLFDHQFSVELANIRQTKVKGFENGTLFTGYRIVYPLSYEEEHLGTVEISHPMLSVLEDLNQLYPEQYFISADVQNEKKVSTPNIENLKIPKKILHEIEKNIVSQISNASSSEANIFTRKIDGKYYDISIYPLRNFKKESFASICSVSENVNRENSNLIFMIIIIFININLIALGWLVLTNYNKSKLIFSRSKELEIQATKYKLAKEAAEANTHAKSMFLANMSHEIRTPMNGICGITEILNQTNLSDDQKSYLGILQQSSDQLLALLNDILDFSKMETHNLKLEKLPINIYNIIDEVNNLYKNRAIQKGLKFHTKIDSNIPYLLGDSIRLRQILSNLINNAVKFTNSGSIELLIEKKSSSPSEMELSFKVKDTGIGIAPDDLPKLFKSFSQVDPATNRKYGGTGLGLAICKQLVFLMKGEINATSYPKTGSIFQFTAKFDLIISAEQKNEIYPTLKLIPV